MEIILCSIASVSARDDDAIVCSICFGPVRSRRTPLGVLSLRKEKKIKVYLPCLSYDDEILSMLVGSNIQ